MHWGELEKKPKHFNVLILLSISPFDQNAILQIYLCIKTGESYS